MVGIAYQDSEFTFDFEFKKGELELLKSRGEKEINLPFQVQIFYTKPNGMKCIRVISQPKQVSFDREKVEKGLDTGILFQHYNYTTSSKAQQGNFKEALDDRFSVQQMMQRNISNQGDVNNLEAFSGFTYQMPESETSKDNTNNMLYNMKSKRKKNVEEQEQYFDFE